MQGRTALHYAVHGRNKKMAETLIDASADVDAQDGKVCVLLTRSNLTCEG